MPTVTPPRLAALLALALCALVLAAAPVLAQTAPETRRVVLMDGTVIVGTIADETADPVVVTTTAGVEQRVPRGSIREITPLFAGRFTRLDPNRSRLFLTPTARTLGRGRGRVSTFVYLFPNVAYGVTDQVDVSGSLFAAGFGDEFAGLLNASTKVQPFRAEGSAAALGATATLPFGSGTDGDFGGVLYGVGTFGSEASAFTGGVVFGYGASFEAGRSELSDGFAVLLAGEHQVSNSFKLLAEGYVPVGLGATGFALLPGVRFFGDRFAVDLYGVVALLKPEGDRDPAQTIGFAPIANFSYNF